MENEDGPINFEARQLYRLIKTYLVNDKDYARVELLNQVINGEDLVDALEYLKEEYKLKIEKDEQKDLLIGKLEDLVWGKKGIFIDDFKGIIKEYKLSLKKITENNSS